MLPVRIINPTTGHHVHAWGLIDTGADDCALPAAYAALLGHRFRAGVRRVVATGNGVTYAYAHTTRIDILATSGRRVVFTIPDTPIDFMPNLDCVLLGATSFLRRFIVTINYPRLYFSIREP